MKHHKTKKAKREALNRDVEEQVLGAMRSHPSPHVRLVAAVRDVLQSAVKDPVPHPPKGEDWSEVG